MALIRVHDSALYLSFSTVIQFRCMVLTVPTTAVATTTHRALLGPINPPTSLVIAIQVALTTQTPSSCNGSTQWILIGLARSAWLGFKLHRGMVSVLSPPFLQKSV